MFKDDAEKQYVIDKLVAHIAGLNKFREELLSGLQTDISKDIIGGTPQQLVLETIQVCLIDEWKHEPAALASLLTPFRALDPKIIEIIDRVENGRPPVVANPLDQNILIDGALFVNRIQLRGHLRRLITPAANLKPILVVTGTTKAGKTYSSKYIDHFCNVQLSIAPNNPRMIVSYRIEFDHERAADLGAKEVAQMMINMLGSTDTVPDNNTNNILYPQQLASKVLATAIATRFTNWFVLDNFRDIGEKKLRKDTSDFLIALSAQITTGAFSNFCRLILIGFDRAKLTVDTDRVEEENIAKCTKADIDQAIIEICRRAPVALDMVWIENFVYTGLPENETKLIELNARLRKLLFAVSELTRLLAAHPDINYEDVLHEMLTGLPAGDAGMNELKTRLTELAESVKDL